MDRPRDAGAFRHPDDGAVTHEGGVERDRHIAFRREPSEMLGEQRVALGQRFAHGPDGQTLLQALDVGELGHEGTVDEDQPAAIDLAQQMTRALGPQLGGGVRRSRQRLGVTHERAQVGVFPLLDAPVRQPLGIEVAERGLAQRRDAVTAGQPVLDGGECLRERLLGTGLHLADFGVHRGLTPPLRHTARSRWLRARAPAPCRRCAPRGHPTARARRRARYSRAGADNG